MPLYSVSGEGGFFFIRWPDSCLREKSYRKFEDEVLSGAIVSAELLIPVFAKMGLQIDTESFSEP